MLRLAVIGHPIAHSRSPAMHNAALDALGIAGRYRAIDIDHVDGMAAMAAAVRLGHLDGANITMPYKAAAHRLADHVTPEAEEASSVNTWYVADGMLCGETTDVAGIRRAWSVRGLPPSGPVLVLGAGGASRAAIVALSSHDLFISARRRDEADRLAAVHEGEAVPWGTGIDGAVVVNCTPVGMHGESLDEGVRRAASGVFDMSYARAETPLVAEARRRGLPVADGLDLLVAQAEAAFVLWTGATPPSGVMERVARNVSSG